jgi:hypothetical protein
MANKKNRPVQMGNIVRDPITGFEGMAIQLVELLNGNLQYAVQPKCEKKDGNKLPYSYNFDTHLLEYVSEGLADKVTPPPEVPIKLGDKVKDKITLLEGIANMRAIFMNGCIYFTVQPEVKDDKAPAESAKGLGQ